LHSLAQLIPATPAGTGARDFDFVLLTSLKPDAWFVHVGHPDGRWWNGAWHTADVESLANGECELSPARVTVFAQRVANTIVDREIAIAHEDDFGNMKLILGTRSKKPLRIPLSALDPQAASRFAFECFARVAQDVQTHGCHLLRTHPDPHTDAEPQHVAPLKRRRTHQPSETSRPASPSPPHKARQTKKQAPTAAERTAQAQLQEVKAELAKARAETAAAVALAAEREPPGLGGSVDRLFSSSSAAAPAVQRRPGASLANPNKAARRVTAVEFASDDEDS